MTPSDLARWESSAGPGYDAAGRLVYSGPGMMYMGPGDKSATQAVHQGLKRDADREDGGGMIRALLAELARRRAMGSNLNFKMPEAPPGGNRTMTIDNSTRYGAASG